MSKTPLETLLDDPVQMRLFQQERAIYEVTELLESVMADQGITRTELANRLGKSKGWVTQLLDGEANKTIRTIADAFAVLGREYRSSQGPIRIGNSSLVPPSPTNTVCAPDPVILKMQRTPITTPVRLTATAY